MATNARIGLGTLVEIENEASPPAYEAIAEPKDITLPNAEIELIDVTHMQSPNRAREYIAGLTDFGDASFEMNYVPGSTSDLRLQALLNSGETKNVRITFASGSIMTFAAFVSGYERNAPVGDAMTATVTLKVSGAPTIT